METKEISTLLSIEQKAQNSEEPSQLLFNNKSVISYIKTQCPSMLPVYKTIHNAQIYLESILPNKKQADDQGKFINACRFIDVKKNELTNKMEKIIKNLPYSKNHLSSKICVTEATSYYTCYDCDENVSYCLECFNSNFHKGHLFTLTMDSDYIICDCGHSKLTSKEKWCQQHQNLENQKIDCEEYQKVKQEWYFLLCLFLAAFTQTGPEKSNDGIIRRPTLNYTDILIAGFDMMNPLVEKYQFYQKVMSQIILGQSFIQSQPIFVILMDRYSQGLLFQKIKYLLQTVIASELISQQLFSMILKYCASTTFLNEDQAGIVQFSVQYFMRSNRQSVQSLINPGNINILIPQNDLEDENILEFYHSLYIELCNFHPDLAIKILLMIFKLPVSSWLKLFNKKGKYSNSFISSLNKLVFKLFSCFKQQARIKTKINTFVSKLAEKIFLYLIEINGSGCNKEWKVLSLIFLLSALVSSNFSKQAISQMQQRLINIIQSKKIEAKLCQKMLAMLQIKRVSSLKKAKAYASESYILLSIITNISMRLNLQVNLETIKNLNFSMSKQPVENEIDSLVLYASLVKEKYICQYTSLPLMIIQTHINFKDVAKEDLFQLFRQLAFVYQSRNRIQFKQCLLFFVQDSVELRQFMQKQYEFYKKSQIKISQIKFPICFNSRLCLHQNAEEKLKRIIYQLAFKQYLPLKEQKSSTFNFIQNYQVALEKCKEHYGDYENPQFSRLLNSYFEVLLTVHLTSNHHHVDIALQNFMSNETYKFFLDNKNQQDMQLYIQAMRKQNQDTILLDKAADKSPSEAVELKKKRQLKLKSIKERQQKVMKANWQQCEKSPQKEAQNFCIVCRHDDNSEPLQYLCYARYSNILLQKMLNSSNQFLLFTSCGHMVHQTCLAKNINSKNIGTSYRCFYCKERSNIRLPVNQEINNKMYEDIYKYIMTITCLQKHPNQKINGEEENKIITENNFACQLYNSIFYQIYLYFLTDSQTFNRYMFFIIPSLVAILRFCKKKDMKFNSAIPEDDQLARKIMMKIDKLIDQPGKYIQKVSISDVIANQERQEKQLDIFNDIDSLFLELRGMNHAPINTYKQLQKYGMFTLPQNLLQLKKMADKCYQCHTLTDRLKICLLCQQNTCLNCQSIWQVHCSEHHRGKTVSIMVHNGTYCYESPNRGQKFKSLYRDVFGSYYDSSQINGYEKWYTLDRIAYEKVVRDIVLDNIGEYEIKDEDNYWQ